MVFSEINPFIRYARHLKVNENSCFDNVIALDARLFYTLDGYGKINVKNKEYEMSPHSLIIINSGTEYEIIAPEDSVTYIAINFDFTQRANTITIPVSPVSREKYTKEMLLDYCTFDDARELSEVIYIKHITSIRKKLDNIINEHIQKMLYFGSRSGHILAQCIADCMKFLQIGADDTQKQNANRIISYIHEHFNENLTNRTIGEFFGYHPNYISALVKRLTGMSIHKYIIHVRLMYAANYLENTSYSCEEIAQICGFCDMAHFSKCFKSHYGITPSKYKNI